MDYLVLHLHQAPSEEEIWIELLGSDRCVVDTNTEYESERHVSGIEISWR